MTIYEELEKRGLINQITSDELIKNLESPMTVYCGFDPTADSLHIGHLLPICLLKHFANKGHQPIALIGGGTGLIGDPSFKKDERNLNSKEIVQSYVDGIQNQLKNILRGTDMIFANNYEWIKEINMIDFLRDYGKHFTVNYMINKDSVSSRIESGISFTEFSYTIIQALDYLELYKRYNCRVQIGGSDQWGNITSGLELMRRENVNEKPYGLTVPLVTKSDGTKFGKTEGGAIWLDPKKTSPYEFYQFFLNTNDDDVIKYLKYFTFIDLEEINELNKLVKHSPHKRVAQKKLAEEVTIFVHGKKILNQVLKITETLFSGNIKDLTKEEVETYFTNIKQYRMSRDSNIVEGLIEVKLAKSKREAKEFIVAGSIRINGEVIKDVNYLFKNEDFVGDHYLMVKRGKKKIHFIKVD